MAKRQALGRGLSALLDNGESTGSAAGAAGKKSLPKGTVGNVAGNIAMLKISQIEANPFQPRNTFDQDRLTELAQSIKELGIIQPITVRKISVGKYQLISGERRFRASQLADLEQIPAYIRSANDQSMLEMALVENIQRENLDAIEIAISYQRLIDECNLTQDALGERVGKNRSTITNYLRLLNLPGEIQVAIIEKQITMGHARALAGVSDGEKQMAIFRAVLSQSLSVRQTEALASGKAVVTNPKPSVILSSEDKKFKIDLQNKFGDKSSFKRNNAGGGRVELSFESNAELRRIIDLLDL